MFIMCYYDVLFPILLFCYRTLAKYNVLYLRINKLGTTLIKKFYQGDLI